MKSTGMRDRLIDSLFAFHWLLVGRRSLAAAFLVAATTAFAADNFAAREAISGNTQSGSNTTATREATDPATIDYETGTTRTGTNTVWYQWTAPASGTFQINTIGSTFDTQLYLSTGTTAPGTKVASNEDAPSGGPRSEVTFTATLGTIYNIMVSGYDEDGGGNARGNITINIVAQGTPPSGYTLTVETAGVGTGSVNQSPDPTNGRYPTNATVSLQAIPGAGSTFAGWSGDATGTVNPINVVMNGNKSVTATFTGGGGGAPANNNFANATLITGTTASGTTVGATTETGEPPTVKYPTSGAGATSPSGNNSVWFRWVAPSGGQVSISTTFTGAEWDTQLAVVQGAIGTVVDSNEDDPDRSGSNSKVTFTPTPSLTYHIRVTGWNNQSGTFTLAITQGGGGVTNRYTLNLLTNGTGTITRTAPDTDGKYASNALVSLTANPGAGAGFAGWTRDTNSANRTISIRMTSNWDLTANFTNTAAALAPVNLRSASRFAVLAASEITSIPTSAIKGDVGLSPAARSGIAGLTPAEVDGSIFAANDTDPIPAMLTQAQGDLTIAYNDARDRTPVPAGTFLNPGSGNLGGLTLVPGLYKFTGQALISGSDVTLTGSASDVWIFQIGSALIVADGIKVVLAGGAQASNIFWQVGTSASLGTTVIFKGTIMADQSISLATGARLDGRALARIAAVTLQSTTITIPQGGGGGGVTNRYTLTLVTNGNGRITRNTNPGADGKYTSNAVVTLTAAANSGAGFAGLSGPVESASGLSATVRMNADKTITVNFTNTAPNNNILTLSTEGQGRVSPNYSNRSLVIGRRYTLTATPARYWLFREWRTPLGVVNTPRLTFTREEGLQLTAVFAPNRFGPVAGVYEGLVYTANHGNDHSGLGHFRIRISTLGRYSGIVRLGGRIFSVSGLLNPDGNGPVRVNRGASGVLDGTLTLNMDGNELTGTLGGVPLRGHRSAYNGRTTLAPQAGTYILILPGNDDVNGTAPDGTNGPAGDGYGRVTVDARGNVRITGVLADGTAFSQGTIIAPDGRWPFYASLYGNRGVIVGWLDLNNTSTASIDANVDGPLHWFKPALQRGLYPEGFHRAIDAIGSLFIAPHRGTRMLNWQNGAGAGEIGGNGLGAPIVVGLNMSPLNVISVGGANENRVRFTVSSAGLLTGNFRHPGNNRTTTVRGGVFQKQNAVGGFFLGLVDGGYASLQDSTNPVVTVAQSLSGSTLNIVGGGRSTGIFTQIGTGNIAFTDIGYTPRLDSGVANPNLGVGTYNYAAGDDVGELNMLGTYRGKPVVIQILMFFTSNNAGYLVAQATAGGSGIAVSNFTITTP